VRIESSNTKRVFHIPAPVATQARTWIAGRSSMPIKLCADDPELAAPALELKAGEVWRDAVIEDGCIATIEGDGRVRWTLPKYAHKPN
jgi:hypothetical protein